MSAEVEGSAVLPLLEAGAFGVDGDGGIEAVEFDSGVPLALSGAGDFFFLVIILFLFHKEPRIHLSNLTRHTEIQS